MHPAILDLPPTLYVMLSPRLTHGPMLVDRARTYATWVSDLAHWADRQSRRLGHIPPLADMEHSRRLRQWARGILARDCPDLEQWLAAN